MPVSLQSPADIVNASLARIGFKNRVSHLFEGSRAAKNALDIYGQTRDELLRMGEWPFAQRDLLGTVIKQAPAGGYTVAIPWSNTYPPLPWLYEYQYPDNCIKIKTVKSPLAVVPNFAPLPNLFALANDGNQRVILSNISGAVVTYVGRITNPTDMPVDFVEALVASLGRRLAPLLANLDAVKLEAQDEQVETSIAQKQQG